MSEEAPLKKVCVDFEALIRAFEDRDYEESHFLDLESGEVLTVLEADFEEEHLHPIAAEIDSHPDRYLGIPMLQPDDILEDLAAFVRQEGVEELVSRVREALGNGLGGGGIQDLFEDHPEMAEAWIAYRKAALRDRIQEWLATRGVQGVDADSEAGA